jgi:hypothetical protein
LAGLLGNKHLNFWGLRDGRRIIETAWYSYVKVSLGLKYIRPSYYDSGVMVWPC